LTGFEGTQKEEIGALDEVQRKSGREETKNAKNTTQNSHHQSKVKKTGPKHARPKSLPKGKGENS